MAINYVNLAIVIISSILATSVDGQHDPHFTENRTVITHLFEWRWQDVAAECERFLGPFGYGGVQVSPPNENAIVMNDNEQRPWWERYQPVSYKLATRSGSAQEFQDMVSRCNMAGVRVFVDAVINHMTGAAMSGIGTGESGYNAGEEKFDGVPYSYLDFHHNNGGECPSESGDIGSNYGDPVVIRNCRLSSLLDLNHKKKWVQDKIVDYLNTLVGYGVAGFRVDASKHMWPEELKVIYDRLDNLPTAHLFPENARPFIYQEVIDNGGEAVEAKEYFGLGCVTEFKACAKIGNVFRKWGPDGNPFPEKPEQLSYLESWGEGWGFMPDGVAFTFISNHDNQRGHGSGGASILTFREDRIYKMAQAFLLAWPYGVARVMSSYYWEKRPDPENPSKDLNDWIGPPHDDAYHTLPVTVNDDLTCGEPGCDWICEHRWRQVYNMVRFRNIVQGTAVTHWWSRKDLIAFSRDGKGFLAINNDVVDFVETVPTSLPDGSYCDVISGNYENGRCTGKTIVVSNGEIHLNISHTDLDPMIAIHLGSKL